MDIKKMMDPEITAFIDNFYKAPTDFLKKLREEGEAKRIPILRRETEGFLTVVLKILSPKSILEIGTAIGYSASLFASLCKEAHITTLEKDIDMAKLARSNVKAAGFDRRVTVIEGDARQTASSLIDTYDFIFIDASKSHYREFWDAVIKSLRPDGVVVCDNILMSGRTASEKYDPAHKFRTSRRKMCEFLEYITSCENFTTSLITSSDGLSISVLKGKK